MTMHIWALTKCTATHWAGDRAATIGAALAFHCAFSLAPLLIILVTVTGWIVGAETAHGQLSFQLTSLFGAATAKILLEAMKSSQSSNGMVATVVSIASLLVGATTVFAALEAALEAFARSLEGSISLRDVKKSLQDIGDDPSKDGDKKKQEEKSKEPDKPTFGPKREG